MNRLFLGINIHLFTGGLAFVTHQWWLNSTYDQLRASGVLMWIAVVGVVSTFSTSGGFIGEESPDRRLVVKYSCILVAASVAAAALSYGFSGNRLFAEIIPFTGLFILHGIFKNKLAGTAERQNSL